MNFRRASFSPSPCRELGIAPVTLYLDVGPQGQLREQGQKILGS